MKYPHTPILPWSPNHIYDQDDMFLTDVNCFKGKKVIYTEKLDGEGTSCLRHKIHARSEDGYGRSWQTYMKRYYTMFVNDIPENMQIVGECVYAIHSIEYTKLPTLFYVFGIFVDGISLSWNDVVMWSELIGLDTEPVLPGSPDFISELSIPKKSEFGDDCEGYVVRNVEAFPISEVMQNMGKVVRDGHCKNEGSWVDTWRKASFIEDPIERLMKKRGVQDAI